MCKTKELSIFNESPFTIALSRESAAKRGCARIERLAVPCNSCGSVIVLGCAKAARYRKTGKAFCDQQCAGDFKRWQYITAEHKAITKEYAQTNLLWRECKVCSRRFVLKRWKSCCCSPGCREQSVRIREKERKEKQAAYNRNRYSYTKDSGSVVCAYCGKNSVFESHAGRRKYCSTSCERKATKQRRSHWERCNGPREYISINKLIDKHKGKCVECGCKVTMQTGEYNATAATVDHIVPLSKGGWHTWSNVQLMCHLCNGRKSDANGVDHQLMLPMTETTPLGV